MLHLFKRRPTLTAEDQPRLHGVLSWERDHVRAAVVKLSEGVADVLGVGVSPVHGLGRAQYPDPERWHLGADVALTQAEDLTEQGSYGRKAVADSVTMSVPDNVTLCVSTTPRRERTHPLKPIKLDDVQALLRNGYRDALDWLDGQQTDRRHVVTCGTIGQMHLDGRPVLDPIGLQGTLLEAEMSFFTVPIEWVRTLEGLALKLEVSITSIIPQRLALESPVTEGLVALVDDSETYLDLVRQGHIVWSAHCPKGATAIIEATVKGLPLPKSEYVHLMQEYRRAALEQNNLDLIAARYWAALKEWMDALGDCVPDERRRRALPAIVYGLDLSRKVPEALQVLETSHWEAALGYSACPRLEPLEALRGGRIIDWTGETNNPAPLSITSLAYYTARQFGPAGDLDRLLLQIIDWRGAA